MTGGHIDDEPLETPVRNPIKSIGHDFMVTAFDKCRPDTFDERQE
jgi:hypothetical protein